MTVRGEHPRPPTGRNQWPLTGAVSVHLRSALLLGILIGFTPSVSLARRACSRTPTTDQITEREGSGLDPAIGQEVNNKADAVSPIHHIPDVTDAFVHNWSCSAHFAGIGSLVEDTGTPQIWPKHMMSQAE